MPGTLDAKTVLRTFWPDMTRWGYSGNSTPTWLVMRP
jgi:hypothetical protein